MEMICINCPMGCLMNVIKNDDGILVSGNVCPRGRAYAEKESTNPTRIVTSSVFVKSGEMPVVSVKTEKDIPKGEIFKILDILKGITLEAPVAIGDVVVGNVLGTGVDIVATRGVQLRVES